MTVSINNQKEKSSQLIANEQVRQLYAGSYLSLVTSLFNTVILAYFQWPVINHQVILVWFAAIWLITLGRLVLTWRFHTLPQPGADLESWGNYFLVGVLLSGIAWGSASYFLFPMNNTAHQALLTVILAGMSAGAVSVLSAKWKAVIFFLVPSLVPLSIQFLSIGDTRFTVLGVVVIVFLFIMLSSARRNHDNIINAIVARIEKQTEIAVTQSQQIFEDMVRNIPGVVYQFRVDSLGARSFPYMSPSVYDMLGIKAMDIMQDAETIFNVIHPEDRDPLEKSVIASMTSLQRWSYEGRFINKITGGIVWFRGTSHPRQNDDGSVLWNGVLFNITTEKRTEHELQRILDQMIDTFYRTDLEGKLLMVSPSVETLLGYTTGELLGQRLSDLYQEKDGREKFLAEIKEHNGIVTDYEAPLVHKDGHAVWVSTNAHYYLDDQGNIAGVEGATRDITAKRDMLLELEKHREDLEALVDARARQLKNSEARFNHLLTSSPAVIYSCDVTESGFVPTYCSENIREIFGLSPDEFLSTENYWANNLHPDDKQWVLEGLQDLFQLNEHEHEYRFHIADDSYRWVHDEIRLIRDDQGKPQEIIGCWLDVTDRKKIEDELQQSEQRFRSLVDNVTDGIYVHTLDGRFIDVNKQACRSLGYSRDELLEKKVPDIEVGIDDERLKTVWPELEAGKVISVDGIHKRKDGSTFPVEVNISMFVMNNESCVIALARDVTQRKQAEEQLKEINKELEAFAYSVSHDLRAPLRSVNGFCNILLDEYADGMDETAIMYMKRIVGASNKMSDLIDDLLLLSRLSRKEIHREKVDLSKMVNESIKQLIASEPGRRLKVTIQPGLVAKADKGLINAVINNLVSNAWKYTSKKEQATIDFFMQTKEDKNIYCVRDNGAGFNMDYINKLFLPFQRLHPESQFEGNGIGLATVQRIIHRHGGQVWAESEEGRGASFYFTLPAT